MKKKQYSVQHGILIHIFQLICLLYLDIIKKMIRIKEVKRSMPNRRIFRTLARDNCGESMEPGECEMMYFAYHPHDEKLKGEVKC